MKSSEIKSGVVHSGYDAVRKFLTRDGDVHADALLIEDTRPNPVLTKRLAVPRDETIKTLPLETIKTLAEQRGFELAEGYQDRVIPYYASDERVDSHGDIVEQSWDFSTFEDNPVMLFSHDWYMPPIGGVLGWEVVTRSDQKYSGRALVLQTLFATAGAYDWADTCFRLAKGGFMRAGSVGFWPGQVIEVQDESERAALGLGRWGCVLRENSLIEWSPCSVPANPGAHQLALGRLKSQGLLKPQDVTCLQELSRRDAIGRKVGGETFRAEQSLLNGVWKMMFPEAKFRPLEKIDDPVRPEDEVTQKGPAVPDKKSEADLAALIGSLSAKVDQVLSTVNDIRDLVEDRVSEAEDEMPTEGGDASAAATASGDEPGDTPEIKAALALIRQ
jgi:hypothetical protein